MPDYNNAKQYILNRLQNELGREYCYHNLQHTLEVINVVSHMGQTEGAGSSEMILLQTAALFHDSGFLTDPANHEAASCEIARQNLPVFGYGKDQIDTICRLILATNLQNTPSNLLEALMRDADLAHLGSPFAAEYSARLYQELKFRGIVQNEEQWLSIEIDFYENHRYFTSSASMALSAGKKAHLKGLYERLNSSPAFGESKNVA